MEPVPDFENDLFNEACIVYGNNKIQTKDARWLRVTEIYLKLLKEGDYDVGGTYNGDVADHWFLFRSDQFGDNFMLHLFISTRYECSFSVAISSKSDLTNVPTKKHGIIKHSHLTQSLTKYNFRKVSDNIYSFVKTFSFTGLDVKQLKDRELFISVRLSSTDSEVTDSSTIQGVKLNHDLSSLLKDPICSDFKIESAEGHQFPVHQAILASQSEVFKAMLKEDTAESQNHRVKLTVISSEDLKCMLQYMYTGTVSNLASRDCRNLLMLADHYNLPGLTTLAQCTLRRQLTSDNAVELAALADMYNCDTLKMAAFKFIKDNPEVLQTDGWKQLKDTDMMKKLFEFMHMEDKKI